MYFSFLSAKENDMLVSCPIELTPGKHPEWAKEGEDEWVRRVLDLPKEGRAYLYALCDNVAVVEHDGKLNRIEVNHLRIASLREWLAAKFSERGLFGSATVITNPNRDAVLLQVKDDKHPNPACCNRYSLFSGSRGVGESALTTAQRELYEEIRNTDIVDEIGELMQHMGDQRLVGVQWPGEYVCQVYVSPAKDDTQFKRWRESIFSEDGLGESNPAILERTHLLDVLREENIAPGRHFLGSHNRLIEIALGLAHTS